MSSASPTRRSCVRPPDAAHPQSVSDVLRDRHVREQRIVLEDGADVAAVGRQVRDVDAAEPHVPAVGLLESGDHPQHGGLARPGRTEHREELAVGDVEVDAVDGRDASEQLRQCAEFDPGCCVGISLL